MSPAVAARSWFFSAAACALSASASKVESGSGAGAFGVFIRDYGRSYVPGTPEFARRQELFKAALAAVEEHNARPGRLWTAVVNAFSDRTADELAALNGWREGAHRGGQPPMGASAFLQATARSPLPEAFSWQGLKATKPGHIKNQRCGNCWAAATAAMLEAHREIYAKGEPKVSMEQLTSCTPNPFKCGGTGGCGGATPELALDYVLSNGVGEDDSQACPAGTTQLATAGASQPAPHEAPVGKSRVAPSPASLSLGLQGWERLPENRYEPLVRALVERGPVAVAVATTWQDSHRGLFSYGSGVYDACERDAVIGHSVLLLGYGREAGAGGKKYWLIQNSWGRGWGENGHFRLLRHDDEEGYCGTNSDPQAGTECEHGRSSVRICGTCGILYDTAVPHFAGRANRSGAVAASSV